MPAKLPLQRVDCKTAGSMFSGLESLPRPLRGTAQGSSRCRKWAFLSLETYFHGRGHRPFPHLWWQQLGLGHFQRGKPIRKRGALAAGATFLGTALYPRRFRDYSFGSSASDQAGTSVDARRLCRRRRHPRPALADLPGFCRGSATNHAGAISCRRFREVAQLHV